MSKIRWIITDQNVTVSYEGKHHIERRGTNLADKLIAALKEDRHDDIPALVDSAKRVASFSQGHFTVVDGQVLINGQVAPRVVGEKIVKFSREGLPYQPIIKFAENLNLNPSFRAVNELFTFLEKNDHPITEAGHFIAYKRVRKDFKDIHSGTYDNSVGQTPEMPRNQVNEDPNQTCSEGLHVANWDYAHTQFASSDPATDIMLEVEVNPADVVSIPVDYNNSKMRVCRYKVLNVVTTPYTGPSLRQTEEAPARVTDGFSAPETEQEESEVIDDGGEKCEECGAYAVFDSVCDVCDHEQGVEEEEEEYCEHCGDTECYGECEDRCDYCGEVECFGECEDEEEDKYPWEDEV